MSRYPESPDEILVEFVQDYKNLFKEHLISIVLYGSAAVGQYIPKKSDINFMVVLAPQAIESIGQALPLVKKWRKQAVSVPMFVTQSYIDSSLDSFPIEFLNMKQAYKTVYGQDMLAALTISPEYLRLQCESQVKGKLLHLRREFLATLGDKEKIIALIRATLPAFAGVFKGLLMLKGIEAPLRHEEVIRRTAEIYSMDQTLIEKVLQVNKPDYKAAESVLLDLCEKYIAEIRKLAFKIDQINQGGKNE
jgi:hypothetical protein